MRGRRRGGAGSGEEVVEEVEMILRLRTVVSILTNLLVVSRDGRPVSGLVRLVVVRRVIRWGDGLVVDREAECQWAGLTDMTQVKAVPARARRRSFRLRLLVLGSGRPGVGDLIPNLLGLSFAIDSEGKEIPEDTPRKEYGSNRS